MKTEESNQGTGLLSGASRTVAAEPLMRFGMLVINLRHLINLQPLLDHNNMPVGVIVHLANGHTLVLQGVDAKTVMNHFSALEDSKEPELGLASQS